MTSVLVSETHSGLGRAVRDLLIARGVTLAAAGDAAATLVITDLVPAFMARAASAYVGLTEERHARIAALITAATARVVLVGGLLPLPGTPPLTAADRDARRIEAVLAEKAAARAVILRVSDVMDPTDPDLRAALRALIDANPTATWPLTDQVQVISLADLAATAVAAVQSRGVDGKWFDIVHPEAASRDAVLAEAGRIARLLVDPDVTEIQPRPAYPPVTARRDGAAGVEALHVRPQASVFVLLAQAIQGMIADSVRNKVIPSILPPMPAVYRALETGDLPLAGCCAVVTGATGQIGAAAARMLVRLGADVIGIARRTEPGAAMERAFADEHAFLDRQRRRLDADRARREGSPPLAGSPGRFRFVAADLTDRDAVAGLAARLCNEAPRIDILIHAAGAISRERQQTAQGIEAVLALHLLAPVALTRLLARSLAGSPGRDGGAWVLNPVTEAQAEHPFDLTDLQSRASYLPAEVLARAQSGLVALTGALAEGMTGSGVNIAAVALPAARTPFLLPLDEPVTGGVTAQQIAQTQRDQRRMQMDTPAHAASRLIEVLLAQGFAQAHGCLITGDEIAGPILTPADDRQRLGALWATAAQLSGLPQ